MHYTLIFAIASLNFLVDTLLNLTLQNSGSGRFVEVRHFENLCSIDPAIFSTTHDVVVIDVKLVNRDLREVSR